MTDKNTNSWIEHDPSSIWLPLLLNRGMYVEIQQVNGAKSLRPVDNVYWGRDGRYTVARYRPVSPRSMS